MPKFERTLPACKMLEWLDKSNFIYRDCRISLIFWQGIYTLKWISVSLCDNYVSTNCTDGKVTQEKLMSLKSMISVKKMDVKSQYDIKGYRFCRTKHSVCHVSSAYWEDRCPDVWPPWTMLVSVTSRLLYKLQEWVQPWQSYVGKS